jgi:hypothetical protein
MNVLMAITAARRPATLLAGQRLACSARLFSSQLPTDEPEVQPEQKLKFSAFARKERDYSYEPINRKMVQYHEEAFKPKDEFTKIPFDPNIRHQFDDMDNHTIYRGLTGLTPEYEP